MSESEGDLTLARIIRQYREAHAACLEIEAALSLAGRQYIQLGQNLEAVRVRVFSIPESTPALAELARKLDNYYEHKSNRDRLAELRASLDPDFHPPR